MKKIMVAVFAALAAASVAKAESNGIEFDGRTNPGVSFRELLTITPGLKIVPPALSSPSKITQAEQPLFKLGKVAKRMLLSELAKADNDLDVQKVLSLLGDEKTDILFNDKIAYFANIGETGRCEVVFYTNNGRILSSLHLFGMPQGQVKVVAVPICTLVEHILWILVDNVLERVVKQVEECYTPSDVEPQPQGHGPIIPLIPPERSH